MTPDFSEQPKLHSKDISLIREEQITEENISILQTELSQGVANANTKREDVMIPIKESIHMYQSHPTEDEVSK